MMAKFDCDLSRQRCMQYRLKILALSQQVTALHLAPAFSCVELLEGIYHGVKREQDTFLLSKGHGCLTQYVILAELGILPAQDLQDYCTKKGRLGAHPDYGTPGIAAATGSLGHGLGMAVGMAYAEKIQAKDSKVFVVLSDGELQEGSTWEAVLMGSNLKLDNLIVCIDFNDFTSLGRLSESHPALFPVAEKWQAFGWDAITIDGHDNQAIHDALQLPHQKPKVIVANTIKGKGVSFMEGVPIWHYRSPNPSEYKQAYQELSAGLL